MNLQCDIMYSNHFQLTGKMRQILKIDSTISKKDGGKVAMKNVKYRKKSFLSFVVVMLFCLLLFPVSADAASVQLNKTSLSLATGKTYTLKISGTKSKVTWSSSKKSVATVTSKGVVKGIAPGTASIKASVKGKSYTCKVTVKNANATAKSLKFQTTDGGVFVRGTSKAKVSFCLNQTSDNVVVSIKSSSGSTVWSKTYSSCKANKTYSFTWNGKKKSGSYAPAGTYVVTVKAGTKVTTSKGLVIRTKEFAGGTGSKSNPFQVATLQQFLNVEKYNGYYFKQTANIDGKGVKKISGIYSEDNPFTGTYTGNGFKIRNLILQDGSKDNLALFGGVGEKGTLKNITVEGIDLIGRDRNAVLVKTNGGKINKCTVKNSYISGDRVAGMLCDVNQESGQIINCVVNGGKITISNSIHFGDIHGAGICVDNHGMVTDCSVKNLSIKGILNYGYACISGLVKWNTGKLSNSGATNTVLEADGSIREKRIGGICEHNEGNISGCYFTGTAEANGVYENQGIFR